MLVVGHACTGMGRWGHAGSRRLRSFLSLHAEARVLSAKARMRTRSPTTAGGRAHASTFKLERRAAYTNWNMLHGMSVSQAPSRAYGRTCMVYSLAALRIQVSLWPLSERTR